MKKISAVFLILILLLFCCKKNDTAIDGENTETSDSDSKSKDKSINVTQYSIIDGALSYEAKDLIGKVWKNMTKEEKAKCNWLYFGDKVTVLEEKDIKGEAYYYYQLPDETKYWIKKDALVEKFIVINQEDVETYSQPDLDYISNLKLQPGDIGLYRTEKNGFFKVDFWAYRSAKTDGDRSWVGTKWIKNGYTDNIFAAKEAYYLYLAYYREISKNDLKGAYDFVKKAKEATGGKITDISNVVSLYLADLEERIGGISD